MCAIFGVWGDEFSNTTNNLHSLNLMQSRGPDSFDYLSLPKEKIFFGHRRLSIIDLSNGGSQPMQSSSGKYLITFNGEIYNHEELTEQIVKKDPSFRKKSTSDTEALVEHIDYFGLEKTLLCVRGMFAFGLYNFEEKTLALVRDRMGEKPLYFTRQNKNVFFSSEMKAIISSNPDQLFISNSSLHWFFKQSCIPSPHSIYKDVFKVMPGEIITFTDNGNTQLSTKYWNIKNEASRKIRSLARTSNEYISLAENIIDQAVDEQMASDVPLGAFLSGGIDSSLIVSSMQKYSNQPVDTFSMGFGGVGDETQQAKAISNHLGTNHHTLICTPQDLLNEVNGLSKIYCEPFADSSQIPTTLLTRLVSKHVTVCLSGDGGDELFGGYSRYIAAPMFAKKILKLPLGLRKILAHFLTILPTEKLADTLNKLDKYFPAAMKQSDYGAKIEKIINILPIISTEDYFHELTRHWKANDILKYIDQQTELEIRQFKNPYSNFISNMMFNDITNYLESDILVKVDRAAMSNSLETRVPFLDKKVVEFALTLPIDLKIRQGESKWILKQILYKRVPKRLLDQPKTGFGIPIGEWLRGDLMDWADDLLQERKIKESGFLVPQKIRQKFEQHINGKQNNEHLLWDVLMFQLWYFNQSNL